MSELIGAEHGERSAGAADAPQRLPGRAAGTRAPARSSWRSRRSGAAATSRASSSRAAGREQALVAVIQQAYVCGVSTRKVDQLVESLGLRISRSEVSRVCAGLDEQVEAFRGRPLEGRYPYVWLDAKVEKVRDGGRVVREVPGDRARRARVGSARGDRPRLRRGGDRGVLARVPARPRQARPDRRAARRLRRARRTEERDRRRCSAVPGSAAPSISCARRSATRARSSSRCWPR